MPDSSIGIKADGGFLPSLALIRGVAALMVVYDHLVGMWLEIHHVHWSPAVKAEQWIFGPLQLMMHGGGLAVSMFFLVSGFVIVLVAQRETLNQFIVRRALRIFPPLWASMILLLLVGGVLFAFGVELPGTANSFVDLFRQATPWTDLLAAATLTNYIFSTPPVNGVAWTLIIEVLFYLSVASLLPLLKTRPRLALGITFTVILFLQLFARVHALLFMLTVNMVYVAFLFLGSLLYLRWANRIDTVSFVLGSLAFWGLFLHGMSSIALVPPFKLSDYGVSYAFAWLAFVALLLLNDRLRLGRLSLFFSRISYSLYLNHGGMGLICLTLLYPVLGYPVSLLVSFLVVVAISYSSFRWVEVPSQRLARSLTSRAASGTPVAPPRPASP